MCVSEVRSLYFLLQLGLTPRVVEEPLQCSISSLFSNVKAGKTLFVILGYTNARARERRAGARRGNVLPAARLSQLLVASKPATGNKVHDNGDDGDEDCGGEAEEVSERGLAVE